MCAICELDIFDLPVLSCIPTIVTPMAMIMKTNTPGGISNSEFQIFIMGSDIFFVNTESNDKVEGI